MSDDLLLKQRDDGVARLTPAAMARDFEEGARASVEGGLSEFGSEER